VARKDSEVGSGHSDGSGNPVGAVQVKRDGGAMTDLLRQLVSMALAIVAMPFALLVDFLLFLSDWVGGE